MGIDLVPGIDQMPVLPHQWSQNCLHLNLNTVNSCLTDTLIMQITAKSPAKINQNRCLTDIDSRYYGLLLKRTVSQGPYSVCYKSPTLLVVLLPYITYTGMCHPKGSWFWSFWFRTGYPFQRRFLERGIIFRTHESSTFVSSHLKVFKDRLLLKIRFNAITSKSLYSCCTLERSLKNWPISRTGYEF